ncbi:hypothetical protein FNB79_13330 [Formosa sediminum]|uniref:Lipoprotein n=1 Tax=Formosa sediminum TaxID=2594004 RepID=A0A516GTR6_9FLAO|nr:hypothetical protein [Formosa sediminum]QDO94907.1 hypothetical protein FNB79_13330 [Formosa sediminum]
MKLLKFLAILLVFTTQACKSVKTNKDNFKTKLSVFQNESEIPIKTASKTVNLNKAPFSLRFYNKAYNLENNLLYAARIAAFRDKSEFDKVKIGIATQYLPCFASGSGIAANRSGSYEHLYFMNDGHHYTMYKDSTSKRLKLLSESDSLLHLEFEINSLVYDDKTMSMENTDLSQFYLAVFIDKNLNGIIDKGELNKLTINM